MKPRPLIRKVIKWGGLVATVFLVALWIGSAWIWLGYLSEWEASVFFNDGALSASLPRWDGEYAGTSWTEGPTGWMMGRSDAPKLSWTGDWRRGSSFWFSFDLPLWAPVLMCAMGTGIAWRFDVLARRRAEINRCPRCRYDRSGLPAGAVCPECGREPA